MTKLFILGCATTAITAASTALVLSHKALSATCTGILYCKHPAVYAYNFMGFFNVACENHPRSLRPETLCNKLLLNHFTLDKVAPHLALSLAVSTVALIYLTWALRPRR